MSIQQYGVGGNEVKIEGSEGIADIPNNRTFFTTLLTKDAPPNPDPVTGLETTEAVFNHFKPNLDITFETEDGQSVEENFAFANVGDFGIDKMTEQSPFLSDLNINKDFYSQSARQLRSNKVLMRAISNPAVKESIIQILEGLAEELKENEKTIHNL